MNRINIVLVEPEIPQNTGNIARTCAATGASLHLIRPLGFEIDDRKLKRAGLDYWHQLDITYYDGLDDFFEKHPNANFYCFSTKAKYRYTDITYPDPVFFDVRQGDKGTSRGISARESRALRSHSDAQRTPLTQSFQFRRDRGLRGPQTK